MLAHGRAQLTELARSCVVRPLTGVLGWSVDVWEMTEDDVDLVVAAYQAILAADSDPSDPVSAMLAKQGIDLGSLLSGAGTGRELITRSDIAEFAAAAAMISEEGCLAIDMHMPNIPKMARRKSDSGVDIFHVKLDGPSSMIGSGDELKLGSVKHAITPKAEGLRYAIANSLSSNELSPSYLARQLTVLHGRLLQEGVSKGTADRLFLFISSFPTQDEVTMVGTAVVDPARKDDLKNQLRLLPKAQGRQKFRIVLFPGLSKIHLRCP